MLTENDVVDAVANHLRADGWRIESTSSTNERGHDILATKDGVTLAIEAKGETSSKPGSRRHGQAFNSGQAISHVSRALYKAASVFSAGQHRAGIALPATDRHRKLTMEIGPALVALNVSVFLVHGDRTVSPLRHSAR